MNHRTGGIRSRNASAGTFTNRPIVVAGIGNVVLVSARVPQQQNGGEHSLALEDHGTVVAWGYNCCGQTDVPAGLSDIRAIAAGGNFSLG